VQQREQDVLYARVSLGQARLCHQRLSDPKSARELAIRDPLGSNPSFRTNFRINDLQHKRLLKNGAASGHVVKPVVNLTGLIAEARFRGSRAGADSA
jgi:hypothetical protein